MDSQAPAAIPRLKTPVVINYASALLGEDCSIPQHGDKRLKAVIDNGASVNLLSEQKASKWEPGNLDCEIQTAND